MTTQPMPYGPLAGVAAGAIPDEQENDGREIVGASDADADAARAGADVDLSRASRDSDGVPVGRADAEADRVRAGGDPDEE